MLCADNANDVTVTITFESGYACNVSEHTSTTVVDLDALVDAPENESVHSIRGTISADGYATEPFTLTVRYIDGSDYELYSQEE